LTEPVFVLCGQTVNRSAIRVSNQRFERPSNETNKRIDSNRNHGASETGAGMTKTDAYSEVHVWNQCVDRMVRVLQRLELHSIRSKRDLKAYEIRLEEIRSELNADFSETMAVRERADEFRFWSWQTVLERQKERAN